MTNTLILVLILMEQYQKFNNRRPLYAAQEADMDDDWWEDAQQDADREDDDEHPLGCECQYCEDNYV